MTPESIVLVAAVLATLIGYADDLSALIWPLLIVLAAIAWVALASALVAVMGRSRFEREGE